MTVWTALSIFLIVVVGTFTTLAIWFGLLSWLGGFFVVRCQNCRHLTMSLAKTAQPSCAHCRHPILMHPIYAANHPGAHVRVRNDPLKY